MEKALEINPSSGRLSSRLGNQKSSLTPPSQVMPL